MADKTAKDSVYLEDTEDAREESVYLDENEDGVDDSSDDDEEDIVKALLVGVRKRKPGAPQATPPTGTESDMGTSGDGNMFRISKSVEDKQLVFGWANIAVDIDGTYPLDWDGDVTPPEELEKAAYTFVLKYRATGENHQGGVKGNLVESIMFTKEKQQAMGIPEGIVPEGWWVGFHIPDKEVFAKIKSGEYEMFSVQGSAHRAPTGQ